MTYQPTLFVEKAIPRDNNKANKIDPQDLAFHDWYRFVLSFPPHLVRNYLEDFKVGRNDVLLDPFCGTGTTLIESKLNGIKSFGIEANPFAHFASSVKVDWEVNPDDLIAKSNEIAYIAQEILLQQGIDDNVQYEGNFRDTQLRQLSPEENKLLLTNSISPLPLHKTLILLDCLKQHQSERIYQHQLLALANSLVYSTSNLHFGPEVGVGKKKKDVPVIKPWLIEIGKMARDLSMAKDKSYPSAHAYFADSRCLTNILPPNSVNAVITSPPYPNEKDYTRITRLESVVLGFISNKSDLRLLKNNLIRSNTRNVYKEDDDDKWIELNSDIQKIAEKIEIRRKELGKTSGFEKQYSRVTKLYFGGMARHLANLRTVLKKNALLAYVVGDQASYLRVMIRTGNILSDIAETLGYELIRIDLFRTRLSTTTKEQLREEVVILRWKG